MLRTLLIVLPLIAASAPALADKAEVPGLRPAGELVLLDLEARTVRMAAWRAEAEQRLLDADRAVWRSAEAERACREERREQARRFLDAMDTLGPLLTTEGVKRTRLRATAEVLERAWVPVASVEAEAPCSPEGPADGVVRVAMTGPAVHGLADLPDAPADDPMTLGPDPFGRRALRP